MIWRMPKFAGEIIATNKYHATPASRNIGNPLINFFLINQMSDVVIRSNVNIGVLTNIKNGK